MSDQASDNKKFNTSPMKWLSFGVEFGAVAAIFSYIGYKLDAAFDMSPFFLLAGFFVSFIGMMYLAFKQVKNMRHK
jgi:F0F1-type ATP synthase assembly protein I